MANTSFWAEPMLTGSQLLNGRRCSLMKLCSRISIAKNRSTDSFNFLGSSLCEQFGMDGGGRERTPSVIDGVGVAIDSQGLGQTKNAPPNSIAIHVKAN